MKKMKKNIPTVRMKRSESREDISESSNKVSRGIKLNKAANTEQFPRVALISLGCPKNLVDSEEMLGALVSEGFSLTSDTAEADVIVINTCGFIDSAKQESIDTILGAVEYKKHGKKLVVVGCLVQRYEPELANEIPEIDAFLGVGRNADLPETIRRVLNGEWVLDGRCNSEEWKDLPRIRSTPAWTAYLRIAEGCDNRCSYCVIPDIRGRFRSRPPDKVLAEAEQMAKEGVLEINLIGQDTTKYGEDIPGWNLERLVGEIAKIEGIRWIRLLYCYPTRITDGLISLMASEPKVCKYLDIPFQHGDDRILKAMNRRGSRAEYVDVINRIKNACPNVALRSTMIVGFPGERDEEFDNLCAFVEDVGFDRLGAFIYSREEGTPAADMSGQVPKRIAKRRLDELMTLARKMSAERNRALVGSEIEVLVESPTEGRSWRDAPDIDGIVRLSREAKPGTFVRAKVIGSDDYDLLAEPID